ncbi:MAG: glycosyltransferase [bacterium]
MKVLILTQKVDIDDPILGFFHSWILEFAKNCEKAIVICLEKGKYEFPENVKVLSLGKEKIRIKNQESRINNNFFFLISNFFKKIKYTLRFYNLIWEYRKDYDAVFAHMNPEYVVLGGLFWKLWNKRIGLWYNHKEVNLKLRIAEKLSDKIFTAAEESFRIKSKKINISGHGISLNKVKVESQKLKVNAGKNFKIIYVGRISPIKNQKLLIEAADVLINEEKVKNLKFKFIGAPIFESDKIYFNELKNLAAEKNISFYFEFAGNISHKKVFEEYNIADLSINLCPTGGIDKAVLESMACGSMIIVYNKAFKKILPMDFILNMPDKRELAEKIKWIININEEQKNKIKREMIEEIERNHNLCNLIYKIIIELKS